MSTETVRVLEQTESEADNHWIAAVIAQNYTILTFHYFLEDLLTIDVFSDHVIELFEGNQSWLGSCSDMVVGPGGYTHLLPLLEENFLHPTENIMVTRRCTHHQCLRIGKV